MPVAVCGPLRARRKNFQVAKTQSQRYRAGGVMAPDKVGIGLLCQTRWHRRLAPVLEYFQGQAFFIFFDKTMIISLRNLKGG
jgi:hypothetical protein